jgi:hypothetical protein
MTATQAAAANVIIECILSEQIERLRTERKAVQINSAPGDELPPPWGLGLEVFSVWSSWVCSEE